MQHGSFNIDENLRLLRGDPRNTRLVRAKLRQISREYNLSINSGEMLLLSGTWYITHAGLLKIAYRNRCSAIEVEPALELSSPPEKHWVFRAIVRKRGGRDVFVGYGDADPSNVSPNMRGAELRIAETRAVNRALRKAYGIGLCSSEELPTDAAGAAHNFPPSACSTGDGTFTILDFPNSASSDAWTISNSGVIVGDYSDSEFFVHGFILTAAGFKTIDFPGAPDSALRDINENGDITGIYDALPDFRLHAFLLRDGVFTSIDFPGADQTDGLEINNRGLMAGDYVDASGISHGFVAVERK